jgi:hypothetical protein
MAYDLTSADEEPNVFLLAIRWTSASDHMEGFRQRSEFPGVLAAIRPFVGEIAEMRHYSPTPVTWQALSGPFQTAPADGAHPEEDTMMRIAIIGAGNVGRALGEGWARAGHGHLVRRAQIRRSRSTKTGAGAPPRGSSATTVADAPAGADVIALAVPWDAVPDAISACGDLAGRIIIDATHPLGFDANGLHISPSVFRTRAGRRWRGSRPGLTSSRR